MNPFISFLLIFLLNEVSTHEFSASRDSNATTLHKREESLLPAIETFVSEREEHLRELEVVLRKTSALRKMSAQEIGEYLGNPLNQYHVVKRFVEDWGRLDDYMKSDSSSEDLISQMRREQHQIPRKDELDKSLRDLEKKSGIDPEGYRVML